MLFNGYTPAVVNRIKKGQELMNDAVPLYLPVDNAAQIFVSIISKKETTMSRIAVNLKSPIDIANLRIALSSVIQRFPFYQVYLKKRFFDFIFVRTQDIPIIEEDTKWSNRYVDFNKQKFPFRIKVLGNTIAVELSHIISDGFGTMSFLMSLLAEYLRISGRKVGESIFIKSLDEEIKSEEWACAFRDKFSKEGPPQKIARAAYIPSADMISVDKYYSTRIIMNLDDVRKKAGEHDVTLNEYMSAIYADGLQEMYLEDIAAGRATGRQPIRLQVPVNLRRDYPTTCLRNFSYIYSPVFDISGGKHNFKDLVKKISSYIRHEKQSGALEHQIARNLRAENNFFFKYSPRIVKELLFKVFYHLFARSQYSGVLTNLGDIQLPEELTDEIISFDILPCNSPVPGRNSSLFSYKGKLEMNIGSSCDDLRLEDAIVRKLREQGIESEVIYKRD